MCSIIPTTHNSDSPLLRRPIFPTMQNRTQSTNPWFNQVYPTGCSVGQANLDGPWPRQKVLERKRSFYPRLYIPFKAIMIDRPGMGKVKNWRKSCAHCTKEPEKRSEGKKCKPGEARERQNDSIIILTLTIRISKSLVWFHHNHNPNNLNN